MKLIISALFFFKLHQGIFAFQEIWLNDLTILLERFVFLKSRFTYFSELLLAVLNLYFGSV